MKKSAYFLLSLIIVFISCQQQTKTGTPAPDSTNSNERSTDRPIAPKSQGKGSLSFKMDGRLYETDPQHTKCWTTSGVPLAMLMARGDGGLSISWQMGYEAGKGSYKLDGDNKGTVNFTIDGKSYWTRSVMGDNYLNIIITEVKNKYSLRLLSGTFEGVLEDKEGHKVQITEGRFVTEDI